MKFDLAPSRKAVSLSLLWGVLLPQLILVALNLRGWILIRGEANEQELNTAMAMLCFELTIILVSAALYWLSSKEKLQIGWKVTSVSLIAHASYMWLFIVNVGNMIPDSIQPWILSEENVRRWNITLFMPGAFLSLYALSQYFFSSIRGSKSSLIVFLAVISMPVAWYLLVSLMQPAWKGQYTVVGNIIVATFVVVAFLGTVIHLLNKFLYKLTSPELVEEHYAIVALLGFAAPLSGLALNYTIPFPADFQSTGVYLLTVLNGLVLVVKPNESRFVSIRLFLRCMVFPFIFYFFFVFLPFLPLSVMAILAVGLGFLMLTPLALGLYQTRITLMDYNFCKLSIGQPKAILISVLGLLVLPSYFLIEAMSDKRALDSSMEYFYSHDISGQILSESQLARSAEALVQLRDRKSDIQLPYVSGFYNAVVFGNLVLSDKKISRMYKLLTNDALPEINVSIFGSRGQGRRRFRGGGLEPNRDVTISSIEWLSTSAVGKATTRLTLQNSSDDTHSLYVGQIDLPEGVFVSGLRLKIEGEWVSGRIFDRKTALWVFQKITEVRRDPALLYYQSPTRAELRVYPFPSAGVREVEIDFEFHMGMDSKIAIAEQQVDLNPSVDSPSVLTQRGKTIVSGNMSDLAFQREPYIHFVLDYSRQSKTDTKDYVSAIVQISEELDISELRVTAANIGISESGAQGMLDITDPVRIARYIEDIQLREAGGLWVQQAIAKEILIISEGINEDTFNRTPVFVVVGGKHSFDSKDVSLDAWSWLIPDLAIWYSYTNNKLHKHEIQTGKLNLHDSNSELSSVIALKQGSRISILSADKSSIYESIDDSEISVFEPSKNQFTTVSMTSESRQENLRWPDYADSWVKWRRTNLNPSIVEAQRSAMLKTSREQGLLLPPTSFIVVESPSQWEILMRKEKQSLSNHSGLDFEDEQQTPEPPWWLLLAGLLVFLYFRDRKRHLGSG